MAIVQEYEYFKPKTLKKAVELLAERRNSAVLAGGTDLVCNLKEGTVSPGAVIDIKGIDRLKGIKFKEKKRVLEIGALVTFSELIESGVIREHFPSIMEMAKTVGSVAVRNRATVVGNICSAVPCMDSGPVLMVYDAQINIMGPGGERTVPVSQWFKGNRKTALRKSEIVSGITITIPFSMHSGCFVKLGRYKGEDLAQANVAVLVMLGNRYRVAFGSVAPVPVRAKKIEALLEGKSLEGGLLRKAKEMIAKEIAPITDIRATAEYRLHMCGVMFERAITAAVERLTGGPAYGTALI